MGSATECGRSVFRPSPGRVATVACGGAAGSGLRVQRLPVLLLVGGQAGLGLAVLPPDLQAHRDHGDQHDDDDDEVHVLADEGHVAQPHPGEGQQQHPQQGAGDVPLGEVP
ncbi:hypothetical protein BLX87_23345 [Bacillus sp. VT-16-64]|nr:hypothetical protein BLX87_23345 [Bacillus sp. VT-16-64]